MYLKEYKQTLNEIIRTRLPKARLAKSNTKVKSTFKPKPENKSKLRIKSDP